MVNRNPKKKCCGMNRLTMTKKPLLIFISKGSLFQHIRTSPKSMCFKPLNA